MRWWRNTPRERPATPAEERDEQLSAYLDGDLTSSEAGAVDDALASDASMQQALSGMRRVTDALAQLDEVRAPRSFAIEASTPRAPSRFELTTRIGTAVAAVALTIAFVGDNLTTVDRAADSTSLASTAMQAVPEAAAFTTADSGTEAAATPSTATLAAPAAPAPEGRAAPAPAPQTTGDGTPAAAPVEAQAAAPAPAAAPAAAPAVAPSKAPQPSDGEAARVDVPGDPGGAALDAVQAVLVAALVLLAASAGWQFVRRRR